MGCLILTLLIPIFGGVLYRIVTEIGELILLIIIEVLLITIFTNLRLGVFKELRFHGTHGCQRIGSLPGSTSIITIIFMHLRRWYPHVRTFASI
jgi:hypothetical protein